MGSVWFSDEARATSSFAAPCLPLHRDDLLLVCLKPMKNLGCRSYSYTFVRSTLVAMNLVDMMFVIFSVRVSTTCICVTVLSCAEDYYTTTGRSVVLHFALH